MDAKETQAQTETQAQAQTIKDEELELTKDYYAHRLPRSYYSPTGFTQFFIRLNPWFEDVHTHTQCVFHIIRLRLIIFHTPKFFNGDFHFNFFL